MALEITVPANFGVHNLYTNFHGNVVIKMRDNREMKANSLILSYNSTVFRHMFADLEISTVDMDDFNADTVVTFLEALYGGVVTVTKEIFRDMNKLAFVFKVTWISSRCETFFSSAFIEDFAGSAFNEVNFWFEEALYIRNKIKDAGFVDRYVDKLSNVSNLATDFVEQYMNLNFPDLTSDTLHIMIQIAGKGNLVFLRIVNKNIVSQGMKFDESSRYLLENIDLVSCMEQDITLYEEVFEILFEKVENISASDMKMIMKLYREAIKQYRERPTPSEVVEPKHAQTFPNLFHKRNWNEKLPINQILDVISTSPDIKNIYMAVEALWYNSFDEISAILLESIPTLTLLRETRGWSKIHPDFVKSLLQINKQAVHTFNDCQELVSSTDSVRVVCGDETDLKCIVQEERLYKFYFQHPSVTGCNNPTQCGFLVKVTPLTKETPELFNIELITDAREYPADLHCHADVVSADKMHLVVEWYYKNKTWYNVCISWRGKPQYDEEYVLWRVLWCNNTKARLAVYCDI